MSSEIRKPVLSTAQKPKGLPKSFVRERVPALKTVLVLCSVALALHGTTLSATVSEPAGELASASAQPAVLAAYGYQAEVLADHPVAYWRLNETSGGVAYDQSGGHHGWILGNIALGQPGALSGDPDTAYGFGEALSRVEVPYAAELNPPHFSVECWARVTGGTNRYRAAVSSRDFLTGYMIYANDENRWEFRTRASGSPWQIQLGPSVRTNFWTHLVATFDGTNKSFYVDGVRVATAVNTNYEPNQLQVFRIGAGNNENDPVAGSLYDFEGELDEVAVYDYGLSAERVAAHYRHGRTHSNLSPPQSRPPAPPSAGGIDRAALPKAYAPFGVGAWIWANHTHDKQTCRFWRRFEVPADAVVGEACLRITADNACVIWLDGHELGRCTDCARLTDFDLTWLLTPGTHVLAVEAVNEDGCAGLLAGLRAHLDTAEVLEVLSDRSWWVVPNGQPHWLTSKSPAPDWVPARVVAGFLSPPWTRPPARILRVPLPRPMAPRLWERRWFQVTLLSVCGAAVLFCLRLMGQLALQKKTQALLQVERARIARDFHDDLGGQVTQVVLLGEIARREAQADPAIQARLDQMCARLRQLSSAMREVIWMVNSQRDTLRDFAAFVCKYAESFLAPTAIRCRFAVEVELPEVSFDLPTRRNLFLAVKEALTNAAKHSQASELFLRLHCQRDQVLVVVEDNGRGFELSRRSPENNGLRNITERMRQLGGDCRVISQPGQGCRIELRMPLTMRQPSLVQQLTRFKPGNSPTASSSSADNQPTQPGSANSATL